MDVKRVQVCLERTKEWKSDQSGQQNDGSGHRSELRVFLTDLHRQLVEWGSLSNALKNIPNVAQLLGRLCHNPAVMVQEDVCKLVIQCVMDFYTCTPCNPTEEKAVKWAQSQILHCTSYSKGKKNPCVGVAESVGCSASHFNLTSTLQLLESMVEDLYKVPVTRWDSRANCLVPSKQLSSTTLSHLSELCLPLVTSTSSAVVPLVECLLSCHGNTAEDALSPAFLKAITESQQNAYTAKKNTLTMTYKGRVSLWTRYLPALESEFLNLVQALMDEYPSTEHDSQQLISSRKLPLACVENPSINTALQGLMELLLQNTEGSSFVLNLMEVFSKCVQETRKAAKTAEFHCRVTGMDGFRNQLQVNPLDLPSSLLTLYINNISNRLMQMALDDDHAGRIHVWLLLVRSPGWHHAAVRMLLHGSAESRPACLNIIAWYNMPLVPNRHQQYKARLSDLVTSLRGLCSKTSVQSCDLHCAFNPLHAAEVKGHGHMHNVIHPLMMLFVVNGRGTLQLLADIVKLDTVDKEPSAATSFMFLLDSVEFSTMWDATSQQGFGNRGTHVNDALRECKGAYLAEYQERRLSGEALTLTEKQHSDLLGRYDRIVRRVM
ncbi:Fanconi anemia group C protein-like [Asterias rubens]|uniref:Fanconi anemia group C protein-like n=1 Tax=Asterias rubens TaxID=7604 RepID=UPI001454F704|nr:Fanconi anemia group C protein-like [Asterias rubens]XP_033636646.1 Fanconi anemia group C protein-like [Asterias rubens]XP_033636647.1 Fanconi anemia group C protein-like [Asterias rubens]